MSDSPSLLAAERARVRVPGRRPFFTLFSRSEDFRTHGEHGAAAGPAAMGRLIAFGARVSNHRLQVIPGLA